MLQRAVAPVGRHLAAAGRGIVGRAHRLLQHFVRRHAEREAERAVAVVGIEPVVAGPQSHAGGDLNGLMAGAADLEEDAVLTLERDLAIVQAARGVHDAERADELLRVQARETCIRGRLRSCGRRSSGHRRRIPQPSSLDESRARAPLTRDRREPFPAAGLAVAVIDADATGAPESCVAGDLSGTFSRFPGNTVERHMESPGGSSDRDLVARFRCGDRDAFAALYSAAFSGRLPFGVLHNRRPCSRRRTHTRCFRLAGASRRRIRRRTWRPGRLPLRVWRASSAIGSSGCDSRWIPLDEADVSVRQGQR